MGEGKLCVELFGLEGSLLVGERVHKWKDFPWPHLVVSQTRPLDRWDAAQTVLSEEK